MSKHILITGASTGIGAETHACWLKAIPYLFIIMHPKNRRRRWLIRSMRPVEPPLLSRRICQRKKAAGHLFRPFPPTQTNLDVLVNNAGGLIKRQGVQAYEWRLMEDIFALNTFSAMMVTSLCIPLLEKGEDPSIINLTSVAMRHGAPTATIYGASKAALDSFTRGIAKELAPTIRVNAVAPGVILTPFHDNISTPEQIEAWREGNPLQKNGDPIHIAETIKFLIHNDFINGETIDINGGLFMR